ncbi:FtsK/SpoIIIE domain-containing protein [Agrobacterium tumefaciens]|uniref:FtsK/SpoIIIE domain-containing protein n=1 Tax=Agrobacterium tumefaciens TaxID=358 RepID=UPI0015725435|nr:FtsK/SpoIIIE domain-containing protein [Agrobacterium tumefaciens]NSY51668.1 DNA translocase FtsK [Agrobacterium tumefaciens]NTA45931.1 DNA translocase FtsK [Agrobacterium tumefaciens]WIE36457.1 FtsK/SpoIIIE domain-containing protein [Agrobacterium tumefaciens]
MNPSDLIGAAGATSIRLRLASLTPDDGVARYLLDRLTGEQVAAITRALLLESKTAELLKIALPRSLVSPYGLPDSVMTDERMVAIRHADYDRPALLFANTDEDQGASLGDVTLIGAKQLTEEPGPWVEAAAAGLGLSESQIAAWTAALRGLTAADDWTLHQIASFVAMTRSRIETDAVPVTDALGWALPALRLPRDSGYFLGLGERDRELSRRWKKLFEKLVADRKPLMAKQRPNRQLIENEELREQFAEVRDDIPAGVHPAIEAFIEAVPGWGPEAEALSVFEWEAESVLQLFSGIKLKKASLAQETINFFEFTFPDRLSAADNEYLRVLKGRSLKETREDDREFYEAHRDDLAQDKALRVKWERFVFGRPIECTDFLEGLLRVIERLFGQVNLAGGSRKLSIKSARRSRNQWLDLNADVGLYFGLRYRGLPALLGAAVEWDVPHLFSYEEVLDRAKARQKKYRRNESTARSALQIKFDVALTAGRERATVQLVWTAQPAAIGLELPKDLGRLLKRPFGRSSVARLSVSRKGALQSVSLRDTGTLQPAFGQDAGTLIPRTSTGVDLAKLFPKLVKEATAASRITPAGADEIAAAWKQFAAVYTDALSSLQASGYASATLVRQADAYGALLDSLARNAVGDLNRRDIWEPVLRIGTIEVLGSAPSAIVAPWHPLRLAGVAAKMRSVAGLADYLLSDVDVNFGDSRLFFSDLRDELSHPLYPEVAVGYDGSEPVLLTETSTINDYSLVERPVRDPSEATTDVDPSEAAKQIRALLERYLDLQPHERSNLSIMLYNCDAAGLPLATVSALSSVQDQEEVHCNVLVRHRDRSRLSGVYSELLERSENDPDAVVVSETSRNFMSKLRIGVMLDVAGSSKSAGGREIDVAFLHDVVSRQAREHWFPVPALPDNPTLLEHVPARWSYRRVTAEDELKATSYLTCPRQPDAGWSYIDAVANIIRRQSHGPDEHYLPARQISFQDGGLKGMFDEVHKLAEWVATYDDLLDKRQLAAQGINVIRYRRQRTHGRNMVVSSTSELRILHVLVKRRLAELSLGLDDDRLAALARRMIEDANAISGDIVLRAAKRGVSAGELIGLVLSRALVEEELGERAAVAWFLLDDYAEWLGQKEEGIADILGISLSTGQDGLPKLRAIVTEAKYVEQSGLAEASRKSRSQLRQTVARIDDALFGDPGRLDRDLWLSRISDLLLDGTAALGQPNLLERVRDGIRRGVVPIDLRGYSHIFVSGPATDSSSPGEQDQLPEIQMGLQETFTREGLRKLIKAYEAKQNLTELRAQLGEKHTWNGVSYRHPAPRVDWTRSIRDEPPIAVSEKSIRHDYDEDDDEGDPEGGIVIETVEASPADDLSVAVTGDDDGLSGTDAKPALIAAIANDEDEAGVVAATATDVRTSASPLPNSGTTTPTANRFPPAVGGTGITALIESRAQKAREDSADDREWLEGTAQKLRSALLSYNLQAKIVATRLTPNAALIRFMGSDRLRVEDIEAKQSSLLTTHGLRLISISPLPGEIVVGVARPQRQVVSLWDVWGRREINRNAAGVNTSFVLGLKELDGDILYLNLGGPFAGGQQHEPHTLVAGATGSGKSVLIQALLLDIAATNSSDLAHIHLIDPKMGVDYAAIERLPHLQGGVIVDQTRAVEVMEGLVTEMERRYELFRSRGARDIRAFNSKVGTTERLPYVFLIHDEFAEWMLTEDYKSAVTSNVSRLGVKARAAGMHLIFAAQRPDANVMPMQLRDNLGNRLILKVASVGTSEIALGVKGAEQLLGLGHLAARLSGEPAIIYAQAPFLSDDDIDVAVDAILAGDGAAGSAV